MTLAEPDIAPAQTHPPRHLCWSVPITCPHCAGPLTPVTIGRPSIGDTRAVAMCPPCQSQVLITVTISATEPKRTFAGTRKPRGPAPEHGQASRYRAGCRCVPCREANTIDKRRWARR